MITSPSNTLGRIQSPTSFSGFARTLKSHYLFSSRHVVFSSSSHFKPLRRHLWAGTKRLKIKACKDSLSRNSNSEDKDNGSDQAQQLFEVGILLVQSLLVYKIWVSGFFFLGIENDDGA